MTLTPGSATNADAMSKAQEIKGRSLWVDARRRLLRNRAAMVSIVLLATIALMAIFAPMLSAYRYDAIDYSVVSCA